MNSATVGIGTLLGGVALMVAPVAAQPEIAVSPPSIFAQVGGAGDVVTTTLVITDTGSATLSWEVREALTDCLAPVDIPWLSTSPVTGTLGMGQSIPVEVVLDATGLPMGENNGLLCVASNASTNPLVITPVRLLVGSAPAPAPAPTLSPWAVVATALMFLGIGAASLRRIRSRR